ncbi:hypothetical protein [Halarchaeum salinum]|uniref:Uncharacterized protein n=1 Tax=Halarchaeum salinum TaxID=489912 RepID=A0AAV3S911_9EURY
MFDVVDEDGDVVMGLCQSRSDAEEVVEEYGDATAVTPRWSCQKATRGRIFTNDVHDVKIRVTSSYGELRTQLIDTRDGNDVVAKSGAVDSREKALSRAMSYATTWRDYMNRLPPSSESRQSDAE